MPKKERGSNPKVLIILHQETSTPGRVGQRLIQRGFDLDICRPPLDKALPHTASRDRSLLEVGVPKLRSQGVP